MIDGFKDILLSKDTGDVHIAVEIMDNRDTDNKESEANFKTLKSLIISNEKLFPKNSARWVIKCGKEYLTIKGKLGYNSKRQAEYALSSHLTAIIGVSKPTLSTSEKTQVRVTTGWVRAQWVYTPNSDEKIKELTEKVLERKAKEELESIKRYHPYAYGLKVLFKGGKELKSFLIKEKMLEIVMI